MLCIPERLKHGMCLYEINDATKYALYFFPIGFAISSLWGLTEEYFLLVVEKEEVFLSFSLSFSFFSFVPDRTDDRIPTKLVDYPRSLFLNKDLAFNLCIISNICKLKIEFSLNIQEKIMCQLNVITLNWLIILNFLLVMRSSELNFN